MRAACCVTFRPLLASLDPLCPEWRHCGAMAENGGLGSGCAFLALCPWAVSAGLRVFPCNPGCRGQ